MSPEPTDTPDPGAGQSASFGYRDVPADEKEGMVRRVFESVAPRYDLMNDLMSAGVHRLWKNTLIDVVNPRPGEKFLDVAGGTGDIAFRILGRQGERADVTVCDINHAMLEVGRNRAIDRGLLKGLTWSTGDAQALPFPDNSFDLAATRFAVHHFPKPSLQLVEMVRVTKARGRVAVIDLVSPIDPLLAIQYNYLEWRRDPSHTFALTPTELVELVENAGVTVTTTVSREIEVSVEAWLDLTKPTDEVRTEILTRIDAELNGDVQAITGMRPSLRDGQLKFMQTWMIVAGTVGN